MILSFLVKNNRWVEWVVRMTHSGILNRLIWHYDSGRSRTSGLTLNSVWSQYISQNEHLEYPRRWPRHHLLRSLANLICHYGVKLQNRPKRHYFDHQKPPQGQKSLSKPKITQKKKRVIPYEWKKKKRGEGEGKYLQETGLTKM